MTQVNKLLLGITTIVATCAETDDITPLGPLYLALCVDIPGYSIADWDQLTVILRSEGLARISSETITLTDKGRALAANIETIISTSAQKGA